MRLDLPLPIAAHQLLHELQDTRRTSWCGSKGTREWLKSTLQQCLTHVCCPSGAQVLHANAVRMPPIMLDQCSIEGAT